MAEISYTVDPNFNPMRAPRGKVPYVRLPSGKLLSDSDLIIEHLTEAHSVTLDASLCPKDRAVAHAAQRLCEDHLYFLIAYIRWVLPENWPEVRANYFASMPAPIRLVVGYFLRRKVLATLHGQGTTRYTHSELLAKASADFEALSNLLSEEGPFFFGEQPHTIDAVVFSFLDAFLSPRLSPDFQECATAFPNLVAYHAHVKRIYWPALDVRMS